MFEMLHRILLFTVLIIAIFFVVSSFSFSGRLAEGWLDHFYPFIGSINTSCFIRLRSQIMEGSMVAA